MDTRNNLEVIVRPQISRYIKNNEVNDLIKGKTDLTAAHRSLHPAHTATREPLTPFALVKNLIRNTPTTWLILSSSLFFFSFPASVVFQAEWQIDGHMSSHTAQPANIISIKTIKPHWLGRTNIYIFLSKYLQAQIFSSDSPGTNKTLLYSLSLSQTPPPPSSSSSS